MARILVTGAGGLPGRELVRELLLRGFSVIAASRKELDVSDADCTAGAVADTGAGAVVNCAAYTDVDLAESEAEQAWTSNVLGPRNLADICSARSIPLIQLSTAYVFGNSTGEPRREEERTAPEGVYARTMLEGELAVRKNRGPYIIVRTSGLFGSGSGFVNSLLNLAKVREEVPVACDLFLNPTPARALAAALAQLCTMVLNPAFESWGIYHFAGTPSCNWSGFAEMVFKTALECGILEHEVRVRELRSASFSGTAFRPRDARLDCRKMQEVLGISMPHWHDYLREALGGEQD